MAASLVLGCTHPSFFTALATLVSTASTAWSQVKLRTHAVSFGPKPLIAPQDACSLRVVHLLEALHGRCLIREQHAMDALDAVVLPATRVDGGSHPRVTIWELLLGVGPEGGQKLGRPTREGSPELGLPGA